MLCRAPTVTAVVAESAVAGKAVVVPPTNGNQWSTFQLVVCEKQDNTTCPHSSSTPLVCNLASTSNMSVATECDITGPLKATTTYTVEATALEADGTRSATAAGQEFNTPPHGWVGLFNASCFYDA